MGFVALMVIGKLGPAVEGATPQFDAADLIELADPPALIEAPRIATPEDTIVEPVNQAAIEDGSTLAGPSASLGSSESDSTDNDPALTSTGGSESDDTGNESSGTTETSASSNAGDTEAAAGPSDPNSRGEEALATISYPWQQLLPGWTIDFLPEKSGLYGLTLVPEKRIEVYVRDNQTEELLAHVIAHELGHAIDVTLNDGPDRRAWEEARGTGSSPWWPGNGTTDFSTGAGDFAESFAAWQVGSGSFRSTLADPPTQAQIELLAQLAAG